MARASASGVHVHTHKMRMEIGDKSSATQDKANASGESIRMNTLGIATQQHPSHGPSGGPEYSRPSSGSFSLFA